jgi:inosose dehydratase
MNRRSFVCALGGALAARALPAAAPKPDLGFSLYGMKSLPLEHALSVCAETGYTHVELALNPGYPTQPSVFGAEARKLVATQLKGLKLSLPCLMLNLSLTADEKVLAEGLGLIGEAAALGRELSPDAPPVLETVLGGKPPLWEEQKRAMAANLHAWAEAAHKAHTVIALKAHVGSAVNSPERLLWLLEEVKSPSLAVAYDFSHFELGGFDMEESMRLLLPRTRFIHVKDSTGEPPKFQFLLPGEGRTDYVKYFTLLKKYGFSGPVCVEVSGQVFSKPGYDPVDAARRSYAALSTAMQKAG